MALVEAVAASIAAVFAGLQIHLSRRDANSRAVFDHLREIDERVQALWADDTQRAQTELLAFYRREREDLTDGARRYMSLLNSLDMLALAVEKRLVDKDTVSEHVQTLLQPHLVSQTFLRDLQQCCGDQAVYEHFVPFLHDHEAGVQSTPKAIMSDEKRPAPPPPPPPQPREPNEWRGFPPPRAPTPPPPAKTA